MMERTVSALGLVLFCAAAYAVGWMQGRRMGHEDRAWQRKIELARQETIAEATRAVCAIAAVFRAQSEAAIRAEREV